MGFVLVLIGVALFFYVVLQERKLEGGFKEMSDEVSTKMVYLAMLLIFLGLFALGQQYPSTHWTD